MSPRTKIAVVIVGVALVVFVGAPWVYINVIREPAVESFVEQITATSLAETSSGTSGFFALDPTGTWNVAADSQVGYRVDEVYFGQNITAVGRTNGVTGSVTIADLTVVDAEFTADMTSVKSDEPKRDSQFESRIMDVLNYPTATFILTSPITIAPTALTTTVTHAATGSLTLRGTTQPVDVTVVSTIRDGSIVLAGKIVIVFAEWGIPNPSLPGISTQDSGVLEFQLILNR